MHSCLLPRSLSRVVVLARVYVWSGRESDRDSVHHESNEAPLSNRRPQRVTASTPSLSRVTATTGRHRAARNMAAVLVLGLAALSAGSFVVSSVATNTRAAQAATLSAPSAIFVEDFEHRDTASNTLLPDYVSATGKTYSADPNWASYSQCNGIILDRTSTRAGSTWCGTGANGASSYVSLTAVPNALGMLNGGSEHNTNAALSGYTSGNPGAGIEFEADDIALNSSNRFVTLALDAAAMNCTVSAPLYKLFIVDESGTRHAVNSTPLNPCTQGTRITSYTSANTATYVWVSSLVASDTATLLTGSSFSLVVENAQSTGIGNDAAIDNIRVLDATPSLSKSFSSDSVHAGDSTSLTFTVSNTSELAEKSGWAFTDSLPAGLTATGVEANTCAGMVSASGSVVSITDGVLTTGDETCAITVSVTAHPSATTTYTNSADNISGLVGLNTITEPASVTFHTDPTFAVTKSITGVKDAHGNSVALADAAPGDIVHYSVALTNTSTENATSDTPAVVTDDLTQVQDDGSYNLDAAASSPSGPGTISYDSPKLTWSGPLAAGQTSTLTYSVTLNNTASAGDRDVTNTAYIGDASTDTPASCEPASTLCATTQTLLPALAITKSQSRTSVSDGETITYTVTVTNVGPGNYTAGHRASMIDDFSDVSDDATYNDDASATSGDLSVSGASSIVSWSGELAAGGSVTITYSVTYHANQGGDHVLAGTASVPTSEVAAIGTEHASVTLLGSDASESPSASEPAAPSASEVSASSSIATASSSSAGLADTSAGAVGGWMLGAVGVLLLTSGITAAVTGVRLRRE